MLRIMLVLLLMVVGGLVFATAEAQAHRRWVVRRPIARAVLGPPIVRRPLVYRPYYYQPRVVVGVGVGYGGYYGW
jgi:hypothetical protein